MRPLSRGVMQAGAALGLLLFCLLLFLPGQTTLPPFDRDEARFAQASRQMVETGDYVDIRFQDQPRHKKPVGIYWLQTLAAHATGAVDSIATYRLPSWIGATLAVLGTAGLGTLLFGGAAGALGALLLASTLLMGVEARMAKTDAVQLLCVVLAQSVLARAWMGARLTSGKWTGRWDLLFWGAIGVGVLVKGPIVPMVAGLTALSLVILSRSGAWLRPLVTREGVVLGVGIVLPWLLVITLRTHGSFWVDSVGKDLLAKAASGQEGHGAPPGYYLLTFFLTFWPWGALIVPALGAAWVNRQDKGVQFLLAWSVPVWLVFELMPTKLLHYTLPTFPALALLMARTVSARSSDLAPGKARALGAVSFILLAAVGLGVPLLPPLMFRDALSFAGLTAGIFLLAAGGVAWVLRGERPWLAAGTFLAALLNFYVVSFGQTLPAFTSFWVSRSAAALIAPHRAACPGPVTSLGYAEPSLVFLLGTDTRLDQGWPSGEGCHLVLREARYPSPLPPHAHPLGTVTGFNYSKGETVTLTLYRDR